jgi:TPR repeat protein
MGHTSAAFNLAMTYKNLGHHKESVRWLRRAAVRSGGEGLLELAQAELFGIGTTRDVSAAVEKLRRVADKDSRNCQFDREGAMLLLYQIYYDGWLAPRDSEEALLWLRKAAKSGSAAAKGLLPIMGRPSCRKLGARGNEDSSISRRSLTEFGFAVIVISPWLLRSRTSPSASRRAS